MELSEEQFQRYARHLILDEVGEEGQEKLLSSRVLVVGAGGLGSPLLLYLAAAGVGTLGIIDNDRVDLTNLQRQIVHATERVGDLKVESARATLAAVNPDVRVETHPVRLGPDNAAAIIAGYDLVADGSDNFATRYLLTDHCFRLEEAAGRRRAVAVRGPAIDVPALSRRRPPLLPLPVPRAAAARSGAALRGSRHPRRRRRRDGHIAGGRGAEGIARARRQPRRHALDLRRARARFHRIRIGKDPDCPTCGAGAASAR